VLTYSDIVAMGLLGATALTAGFFAYLYKVKRQPHLLVWTGGWCFLLLHYLCMALESRFGALPWFLVLEPWLLAVAALLFFYAVRVYSQNPPRILPIFAGALLFGIWSTIYGLEKTWFGPQIGVGIVFLAVAWLFWQEGRRRETDAEKLLGLVFLLWAFIPMVGMYFAPIGGAGRLEFAELAEVPELLAAILMAVAVFEEEKRCIEQNILALSNLSVATASFMGSEMNRTLEQALECVLNVVRLPVGAIFLRHQDSHGPTAVVSKGFDDGLCRAVQEEKADEDISRLVIRLGGLAVFCDWEREAPESLRSDDAYRRLQQLAAKNGLRTVVGVTLQAKDRTCGVLLLGTPENRRLSHTGLRLLKALSQQIGTAIENSYLLQQTCRRSEELHVLNEIGRALGSVLDQDALFEKIFTEIQRLLDVTSFYIALYDAAENQICFELEVVDGVRLPKRVRPMQNHLIEVILRTRQPVVIQEDFVEEARKLGVEPLQREGSFCGVPLIAYEQVTGVMVVRAPEENRFDEGHLEVMRILAGEASIAIENARLFREEQTKSRHLALLNSISRNAITTLNPDEMLANIAGQLEEGLAFDHIGIGLLDYACKEVVIQAEAGKRRGALGRRLGLDESLVGQVARTGQMCTARDFVNDACGQPVLEDSISAVALPILYAEQLHGILYVETAALTEFSEEERLLLHTLADLISGALHNALTFQKAQEEAITDGLTGVKTHRFLMEALSAEWKRSTRAGRSFSVLLIDLDRFKFVNDFYGHLEGDLVLKRVGHILEEHCRHSDVVARYGGDEFVILMPETNIEQSHQIAQNLRSWVCTDSLLHEKHISASFGIASFPVHGSTPQELIQVADASMYLSKHQGGNAVSTGEHIDAGEAKQWKRNVLEAYLGVTLKRLFFTGPEAFEEIRARIEQFSQTLEAAQPDSGSPGQDGVKNDNSGSSVVETIASLALAIDAKDHFTQGHSSKVAEYASLMAAELGLENGEIEEIRIGGLLHDIGKVGIPEDILNKSGPLNPEEWETMKAHVRYGDEILSPLVAMARIRKMVRHHHEMFDGSGYPDGLAGDKIPLGARIIAIADAYDTITSDRVYKKARTFSAACAEIERCAGAQFDPELVRIFLAAVQALVHQEDVPTREAAL
jgi:diguanylate cyclase (GGDEF)-like protein/putative nucleotidyltransferase with HDIG domain